MNKKWYYVLLLILFCGGTALKFATSHEQMPVGCDEFGYLNLAKTLNNEKQAAKPYLDGLLATLRKNNITQHEYAWMILPHAYHIVPGTSQSINQYPPGTSYVLKWFPSSMRNLFFPAIVMLFFILIPVLISGTFFSKNWNAFDIVFPLFLFIVTVSAPFTTELARVNSLAFTFGLLIAAGMILRNRPFLACFLIAVSVNFRVVNGLMILPALLFLPYATMLNKQSFLINIKLLLKAAVVCIAAMAPLLIYNFNLLGNPFATTYSSIDTAVNNSENFARNLTYYFNINQRWLMVHLAAILALVIYVWRTWISKKDFLKLLSFPTINYLFFGWHAMTMDYYPYASAMILAGFVFGLLSNQTLSGKIVYWSLTGSVLIAVIVGVSGILRYNKKEHITFQQAKEVYMPLCNYDIVWCDLYSGTSEYVCNNSGFRFATSTPRARKIAMTYLHESGYSQLIIPQDIPMKPEDIQVEIANSHLPFQKVNDARFGTMISIPPASKKL